MTTANDLSQALVTNLDGSQGAPLHALFCSLGDDAPKRFARERGAEALCRRYAKESGFPDTLPWSEIPADDRAILEAIASEVFSQARLYIYEQFRDLLNPIEPPSQGNAPCLGGDRST